MSMPPEVVEQVVYFLGTIVLGGIALLVGAFLGHFMGGVMQDWIP